MRLREASIAFQNYENSAPRHCSLTHAFRKWLCSRRLIAAGDWGWINTPMTRPLKYERIDQASSGVIEHGAFGACVVLVDLISILDAAVERRLSEIPSSKKCHRGVLNATNYIMALLRRSTISVPVCINSMTAFALNG